METIRGHLGPQCRKRKKKKSFLFHGYISDHMQPNFFFYFPSFRLRFNLKWRARLLIIQRSMRASPYIFFPPSGSMISRESNLLSFFCLNLKVNPLKTSERYNILCVFFHVLLRVFVFKKDTLKFFSSPI